MDEKLLSQQPGHCNWFIGWRLARAELVAALWQWPCYVGCTFYCRVLLGDPWYTDTILQQARRAPERPGPPRGYTYDSVIARPGPRAGAWGGQQVHREFIVYDSVQVYPEYKIFVNV